MSTRADEVVLRMLSRVGGVTEAPQIKQLMHRVLVYVTALEALEDSLRTCNNAGFFPGPPPAPRFRLPTTRTGVTHKIKFPPTPGEEGVRLYIQTGVYDDGTLGEVFLKADKQGSFTSGVLDALSIVFSTALQHGVPLSVLVEKLTNLRFGAATLGGSATVPRCTSIVDYLARWLRAGFIKEPQEDIEQPEETKE